MRLLPKIAPVLAAVAVATLAISGATSAKPGGGPIKVICVNRDLSRVTFEQSPRSCILLARQGGASEQIELSSMKWKQWGGARARGTGKFGDPNATPAKVTLSKPATVCGHLAYTRSKVRTPEIPGLGQSLLRTLFRTCETG